jgi:hypothetical protein
MPIATLAILGSLMFAFPLAFEAGEGGPAVSMLGLLITAAAAGWGVVASLRAEYPWPGLPRRGSGGRADWRMLVAYAVVGGVLVALALWRIARLRG